MSENPGRLQNCAVGCGWGSQLLQSTPGSEICVMPPDGAAMSPQLELEKTAAAVALGPQKQSPVQPGISSRPALQALPSPTQQAR